MAAPNINPIFTGVPHIAFQSAAMTAANATLDITSGTVYTLFTAGSNGSFVREVRLKACPANNTAATVARLWINNGSAVGTATNSALFAELGLPATTAGAAVAQPDFSIPVNLALPAGYILYLTLGTAPGGSGQFNAVTVGGDY